MANCFIGYNNLISLATLSGGSWAGTLPLANLKDRILSKPARSTNDDATSTKFTIALDAPRPVRVIALCRHNMSVGGLVRFRAYSDAGLTALEYDSDWLEAWPAVYQSIDLEWEADNFWTGVPTEDDLDGYSWNYVHIPPQLIYQQYWTVEIDDTSNPDGYIEIGRVFIANGWQPIYNMNVGASIGYNSRSTVSEAQDGTEYFDERTAYRVANFSLSAIDVDEAMGQAFDIMRRVDISREVLFVYNPDDTVNLLRRTFLGRLRELSPIEQPYSHLYSTSFTIKELL